MYQLIIKGTVAEATHALSERGFHPSDRLSVPTIVETMTSHVASRVDVSDVCEPGVIRWFADTCATDSPFPVGTLLHYSKR